MQKINGVLSNVTTEDIKLLESNPKKFWKEVTGIGEHAFSGCINLQSIEIPDGITEIGEYAFYDCKSLKSITIPNSVNEIGRCAFERCENLKSIIIPEGVTRIGFNAFSNCKSLENVVLSEGVPEIGGSAFSGCENLKSIVIPKGVTEIGSSVFCGCKSLKSITIPNSVNEIGLFAFRDCKNLENVVLSEGVTEIGGSAFSGCENLKSIVIPESVTKIGFNTFSNCKSLESIIIPEGVTDIGGSAFSGCTNLKSIIIPNSVNEMGLFAFEGCKNLENVVLSEGVTEIGGGAFSGCTNLKNIVIPHSVTEIGINAFYDCKNLENVIIPNSVTKIGDYAFERCENLKSIVIPEGVTRIGFNAFSNCKSLESIIIPEGVTEIGGCAFFGCENLKSIVIPESVTKIGFNTFSNCKSLESIIIPEGVTEIGEYAFLDCKNLENVVLSEGVTEIGGSTFYGCENLKSIVIPHSVTEIGINAFYDCKNLENVIIPNSVTRIVQNAFCGCINLNIKYKNVEIKNDYLYDKTQALQTLIEAKDEDLEKYAQLINSNIDIKSNLFKQDELEHLNLSRWNNLMKKVLPTIDKEKFDAVNLTDFTRLVKNLGLFDGESKITVKNQSGKIIEMNTADLAYNFLQKFIQDIPFNNMHMYLQGIKELGQNAEFLKFINNKNNYSDLISKMQEQGKEGLATQIYEWFVERGNLSLGENEDDSNVTNLPTSEKNRYKVRTYEECEHGVEKTRWKSPTIDLLLHEFATKKFAGITTVRDREIADNFANISDYQQKHFDKAKEIDKEREDSGVPDYIVGKHIGQNRTQAYKEYFELTGMMRDEILRNAESVMENQVDVSNKIFTYDTLAKSDIANFSIGFMTSCCARLYGAGAGAMRGAILSKDMQPLVVKNDKDEIVAYSILYINREQGYAVLNDIEVNTRYAGHDEELKIIYEKMRRCAVENIEEYNKTAKVPVDKINCGISPNWSAVNEYIEANPQSSILSAPNFDDFKYAGSGSWSGDWHRNQFTIWTRDERER